MQCTEYDCNALHNRGQFVSEQTGCLDASYLVSVTERRALHNLNARYVNDIQVIF